MNITAAGNLVPSELEASAKIPSLALQAREHPSLRGTIAPTLGLAQAGDRCWDVIIVGAGPAGAMAAHQLARMGKAVLLVDKAWFPRWKVCGGCLNVGALATLRKANLCRLAEQCGAVPLRSVELAAGSSHVSLPLPGGAVLSREAFDAALVRAAIEAGADFLPGVVAALGEDRRAVRSVILTAFGPNASGRAAGLVPAGINPAARSGFPNALGQGERQREASARLVIVAVGLGELGRAGETRFGSAVDKQSRIGAGVVADRAPAFYRAGTIYMACGSSGYLGLARREDGRLNLAAACDGSLIRQCGGPGQAAATILDQVRWPPIPDLAGLGWRGTPGLTRRARQLAGDRVLVLGDAAGYVEPFTGEGMAWALAAGTAVAPLAGRAVESWKREWANEWIALYASRIARRQWPCRLVAQLLRRPALVRASIGMLRHAPGLANPFLRRFAGK